MSETDEESYIISNTFDTTGISLRWPHIVFGLCYLVLGTLFVSQVYNSSDPVAYLHGADSLINGGPLYRGQPGIVYPPAFYALLAIVFYPIVGNQILQNQAASIVVLSGIYVSAVLISTYYSTGLIQKRHRNAWALFVLFNPLIWFGSYFFGQADVIVGALVLVAVAAMNRERWILVGMALALAASIKIWPAGFFFPLLFHQRERIRDIVFGAAPVVAFNAGLVLSIPDTMGFFLYRKSFTSAGFLQMMSLKLFNYQIQFTEFIFIVVILSVIGYATFGYLPNLTARFLVIGFTVPYVLAANRYRWIPFAMLLGWYGFKHYDLTGTKFIHYACAFSAIASLTQFLHLFATSPKTYLHTLYDGYLTVPFLDSPSMLAHELQKWLLVLHVVIGAIVVIKFLRWSIKRDQHDNSPFSD